MRDCGGIARALGFCTKHYTRYKKHGDPLMVARPSGRGGAQAMRARGRALAESRRQAYESGATVEDMAADAGISVSAMLNYLRSRCGISFRATPGVVSADAVLIGIQTQVCPWCQRGPFRLLPLHTLQIHGLAADDLCDWADIPRSWATCDPDLSELLRQLNTGRWPSDVMRMRSLLCDSKGQHLSDAGRRALRDTRRRTIERLGPKRIREIALNGLSHVSDESRQRSGRRLGEMRARQIRRLTPADYENIRRRVAAGDSQRAIAQDFRISTSHVSAIWTGKRPRPRKF